MHIHTSIRTHRGIFKDTYKYALSHIHTRIHILMGTFTHIPVHGHRYTCSHLYLHILTYTHMHEHTHTCTYTYMDRQLSRKEM